MVCADAVVVLERVSHAERTVLGGDVGLAPACPESVAARHAGHLLCVLSVVRQRRARLLRLPIRWHAAGGWFHHILFCPARIPPRTRPPTSCLARQLGLAAVGVVSHLLRVWRGEASKRGPRVAPFHGNG